MSGSPSSPIKCTIFPLLNDAGMNELSNVISRELSANGVSTNGHHRGLRGEAVRAQDELGVPFAVTVDHRSPNDTVAVRGATVRAGARQDRGGAARPAGAMRATWVQATAGMEKQTAAAE